MTRAELQLWNTTLITVAITDPYLSDMRMIVGRVVYSVDCGRIPSDVAVYCDRKDEPEMMA